MIAQLHHALDFRATARIKLFYVAKLDANGSRDYGGEVPLSCNYDCNYEESECKSRIS